VKIFRFGDAGQERPGLLSPQAGRVDVSAFGEDYGEAFFGSNGLARLAAWYADHAAECPSVGADARIGPPILRPSKIVCVGLNYRGHALEQGAKLPPEPMLFMKSTTALCGPYDDLPLPRASKKTDYSERDHQKERGGQFVKGKSADGFAPLGPLLVTPDELAHGNVPLKLRVNGQLMQDGNSSDLIFDVPTLVSHISEFMTLLPGDVISTGTPEGVGMGRNPPVFLQVGDVVDYEAEGLGAARQRVVAPP
jgi:2,4-diketo-3-deoxy-L-fuconate hydrolase